MNYGGGNKESDGVTYRGVDFFNRYHKAFGEVIKAEMVARPDEVYYLFTLENQDGEEMVFKASFSSGYIGTGPSGTQEVLEKCGFDVDEYFTTTHTNFLLTK